MDITILRTMTWLSKIDAEGTKWHGCTIQQIFDGGHKSYLRYMYYHYDRLTFIPEILNALAIREEYRIKKPGKNLEMYEKLKIHFKELPANKGVNKIIRDKYGKKQFKKSLIKQHYNDSVKFSKNSLRLKNQGK